MANRPLEPSAALRQGSLRQTWSWLDRLAVNGRTAKHQSEQVSRESSVPNRPLHSQVYPRVARFRAREPGMLHHGDAAWEAIGPSWCSKGSQDPPVDRKTLVQQRAEFALFMA